MSTYETYQAAKIANPESVIVQNQGNFEAVENIASSQMYRWGECNPADYCMTVKQFLDAGHKFVEGDLTINRQGRVGKVGVVASVDSSNSPDNEVDKVILVLKAKALEESNTIPTETPEDKEVLDEKTYRYEKVKTVFALERDLMHSGEYGELDKDLFYPAFNEVELVSALTKDRLYRRIEVTEKEMAVDAAIEILCKDDHWGDAAYKREWFEALFDEGILTRVNGKG